MSHLVTILSRKSKNLLPSFRSWTLHANAVVTSQPYSLTLSANATGQLSSYTINALPNQNYTFSLVTSNQAATRIRADWYDVNGTLINNTGNWDNVTSFTFTTPANAVTVKISIGNNATIGTFTLTNPQLELGSIATPFEPR